MLYPDLNHCLFICLCSARNPAEKVVSRTEKHNAASEMPLALTSGVTCNPINASTAMLREETEPLASATALLKKHCSFSQPCKKCTWMRKRSWMTWVCASVFHNLTNKHVLFFQSSSEPLIRRHSRQISEFFRADTYAMTSFCYSENCGMFKCHLVDAKCLYYSDCCSCCYLCFVCTMSNGLWEI